MAYGLKPAYHRGGGVIRLNEYKIDASYNTNLFTGDPLKLVTGGTVEIAAPASSLMNIGVFAGCYYTKSNGEHVYKNYWDSPSSATNIVALVWDDPEIVFQVEADQVGTALVQADIGGVADLVTGTGSTTFGTSGWFFDSSAGVGTGSAQVKLLGPAKRDWIFTSAGTAQDVLVVFHEHVLKMSDGI